MSANHDVIVEQIRQEFEKLLGWVREREGATRTAYEMEKGLFGALLALGRSLLALYFVTQCERYKAGEVEGSRGEAIPYHSEKPRGYRSVFGKIEFARSYYYGSGQSQCPADAALNLPRTQCSDLLRQWLERLGVGDPYSKSAQALGEILGQGLWGRDLKVELSEDAELVEEFYQQATAPVPEKERSVLVVQADGKGVPILRGEPAASPLRRGKGEKPGQKKEAIVTAVYTIRPEVRTPESVVASLFQEGTGGSEEGIGNPSDIEKKRREGPQNKQYWVTLEGKASALKFTQQQVSQREGPHIEHRLALTDGCEALQEQVRDHFPEHRLILDMVHAGEYLWKAGNSLFGETSPQRTVWVRKKTLQMLKGRTKEVITELRERAEEQQGNNSGRKVLEQVANYCERNLDCMHYDEYLAAGWPIATGVIEGACRHLVKDRCELSGMRWHKAGAESLLRMRCVEENGDWESLHEYRRNHRQRTLYAGITPQPNGLCSPSAPEVPHIRLAA